MTREEAIHIVGHTNAGISTLNFVDVLERLGLLKFESEETRLVNEAIKKITNIAVSFLGGGAMHTSHLLDAQGAQEVIRVLYKAGFKLVRDK